MILNLSVSTFLIYFYWFQTVTCYKILMVSNVPVPSHYILVNTLAKELVNVGHDVTIISPYSEKNPPKSKNGIYKEIVIEGAIEAAQARKHIFLKMEQMFSFQAEMTVNEFGTLYTKLTLEEPKVQALLASNSHFDVVFVTQCLNDGLKAFAHHFNAPLILFGTMSANNWMHPLVANPAPPSYVPEMVLTYGPNMTFWQRTVNFLYRIFQDLYRNYNFLPTQEKVMKKYFPGTTPDLKDLYYNCSLLLVNSHESLTQALPFVPSVVQIGGFHVKGPKKLPEDLQKYLDEAEEGVVYFSMGSNLKPSQMKNETLKAIIEAFGKLKMKVLWKWDLETLPGKPKNVKISKWFPQNDILAHPNVKLFVTHGGLLSTIETVHHGVPILAFPIYGDQKINAQIAEGIGIGLKIYYRDLTEEKITEALQEVLYNPKYQHNVKMRQKLFHDRPIKPMELAIYWIEFIARNRGAPHLKVAGLNLSWYQYLSLDVVTVLLAFVLFVFYCFYYYLLKILFLFGGKNKKVKFN